MLSASTPRQWRLWRWAARWPNEEASQVVTGSQNSLVCFQQQWDQDNLPPVVAQTEVGVQVEVWIEMGWYRSVVWSEVSQAARVLTG